MNRIPTGLLEALTVSLVCATAGCGSNGAACDGLSVHDSGKSTQVDGAGTSTGTFSVLTYNVAGLPEGISSSHPEIYMVQISPLLNAWDIALVQEDFWYHDDLSSMADHQYQSEPFNAVPDATDMGDGLNRFSVWPFDTFARMPWPGCNGGLDCASDCMATKGFSVARHTMADGVEIDFYNLHMEAGHCPGDIEIRADSVQLLLDVLEVRSQEVPVVMAGDFNLHETKDVDLIQLERLVLEGGMQDACWTLDCGNTTIDRVFFRGTPGIALDVEDWFVPDEFVDAGGNDLSDHHPTAAVLKWRLE